MKSNSPLLAVINFSGSAVGEEAKELGGKYVFVIFGGLRKMVESFKVRWLGGEVGSVRGGWGGSLLSYLTFRRSGGDAVLCCCVNIRIGGAVYPGDG